MTTSCLVNNYNYGRFVEQAVDSALRQTVPLDEIIVVDDGSTDGSPELLRRKYDNEPRVRIVTKSNDGQLSCFNEGFAQSSGDVVFFLDSDDVYAPNYVEESLKVYGRDAHVDFIFCAHHQFGRRVGVQREFANDRDLGYSVILTTYLRNWIGGPTSCLSMRRSVLKKILPLPFQENWRIRADDCLVFGASLAGARKYYLSQPLVHYRVHDKNQFFGRSKDRRADYRRRLAMNSLFGHMQRAMSYDLERLPDLLHREFATIGQPTFRNFRQYARISLGARISMVRRVSQIASMMGHVFHKRVFALERPAAGQIAADSIRPDASDTALCDFGGASTADSLAGPPAIGRAA